MAYSEPQSLVQTMQSGIFREPLSASVSAKCHIQSTFREPVSASIPAECRIQSTFRVAVCASISAKCHVQCTFRVPDSASISAEYRIQRTFRVPASVSICAECHVEFIQSTSLMLYVLSPQNVVFRVHSEYQSVQFYQCRMSCSEYIQSGRLCFYLRRMSYSEYIQSGRLCFYLRRASYSEYIQSGSLCLAPLICNKVCFSPMALYGWLRRRAQEANRGMQSQGHTNWSAIAQSLLLLFIH